MERERLPIIEFESQATKIKTETPTTKTLVFDILDVGFNFYPGQYVMLRVPHPPTGEIPKRAYSIASPPTQKDRLELTIKRTLQGRASVVLTQEVKVGDRFKIKGPFKNREEEGYLQNLLGSGNDCPIPPVTLECMLEFEKEEEKEKVLALMRRFSSATRYAYKRLLEGVPDKEIEKRVAEKHKLNARYVKGRAKSLQKSWQVLSVALAVLRATACLEWCRDHSPLKRVLISGDEVAGGVSPSLPGQGTAAQNRCSFIHLG
jgi:predicted transposase